MKKNRSYGWFLVLLFTILACNLPGAATPVAEAIPGPIQSEVPADAGAPATATISVTHINSPATTSAGLYIYDVESSSTAPEKRAPYGDSYDINRLERPFLQDMTYVPDLDIVKANVGQDVDWFYVSIDLVGTDPNNPMGIDYGVELDTDHDGFGDYAIWASPPYGTNWDTASVRIFKDNNHDTGGLSGDKSDAPIATDGYETLVFNGGAGDSDPDMAWVRMGGGENEIEFAFKKSWSGTVFMLGVVADANFHDVQKLDLVDRYTEVEAGSPVKDKQYYPLKALFAVDNTCREAFGFKPNGYEPQLCPHTVPTPAPKTPQVAGCTNPSQYSNQSSCEAAGCSWVQDPSVIILVSYYCVQ
jgi:hypothetical protein